MLNKVLKSMVLSAVLACFSGVAVAQDVGVLWFAKSAMAERVLAGMQERLGEAAPSIKLEIKDTLADAEEFKTVFAQFEGTKKAIVALRSSGAKTAKAIGPKVPVLFGASNDPVQLGVMADMSAPDGNITGVTYAIPASVSLQSFKAIMPGMKKLLLITEKGHPASAINQKEFKAAASSEGLVIEGVEVSSMDELKAAAEKAAAGYDAAIVGSQKLTQDNANVVVEKMGSKPVFAISSTGVKTGALGGLVANDHKLGRMLADQLVDIVVNGKAVSAVPVQTDPDPVLRLNGETIGSTGVPIPAEILNTAEILE